MERQSKPKSTKKTAKKCSGGCKCESGAEMGYKGKTTTCCGESQRSRK